MESLFRIDARSIKLFRYALSVTLILDLIDRSLDFNAPWFHPYIFVLAFCAYLSLGLGFKIKVSAVLSWIMLAIIHTLDPMLLHGGDILLKLLLFWFIFLPYSSFALILQVIFIYLFNFINKLAPVWLSGDAVEMALNIPQIVKPMGSKLLDYPLLLKFFNYLTLVLEFSGLLLLISRFRIFIIPALILMHIAFGLTMHLGNFPLVDIIALIPFIPSEIFDRLGIKKREEPKAFKFSKFIVIPAFLLVLLVNLNSVRTLDKYIPRFFEDLSYTTHLWQSWSMFAPYPELHKPKLAVEEYKNHRWRIYLLNLD